MIIDIDEKYSTQLDFYKLEKGFTTKREAASHILNLKLAEESEKRIALFNGGTKNE